MDSKCECCGNHYEGDEDSCRCEPCCVSCMKPKGGSEWVRGRACPARNFSEVSRITSLLGEEIELLPCPLCHASMRSVEGWNTRVESAELAALKAKLDAVKDALNHYAEPTNWLCNSHRPLHDCHHDDCTMTDYEGIEGDGWAIARRALAIIDGTEAK